MVQVSDSFAKIDELCRLFAEGRKHTAISMWDELPQEFRVRAMKFVIYVNQNKQLWIDSPEVVLVTPYGEWRMSKDNVQRLVFTVGEIIRAKYS